MKRLILLVAFLLLSGAQYGWAQDVANIVGTVTDATGAVVPGAKVTVANPNKGFTREYVANTAGEYAAAKVPIGGYVVTAEAHGFEKLVRSGITLAVGQTQRVDLQLTVGQVTQEVHVVGNLPHVETETAAISGVITATQISDLNLNGRFFGSLTLLVPGAVQDNSTDFSHLGHSSAEIGASFNGNREEYSNLELDGGNNSDEGSGANGGDVTPSLNSIAEFRITTSNYGADVGQHAGALIEVATKSGTKDFHGSLHEFVRNDTMDANDWFINQTIAPPGGKAPKTPLKWNIFGGTFGGPFYIPGHYNTDRTKTFFFYSQEFARYREGTVVSNGTPSLRMGQGDFSECDPSSPNANAIIIGQGCTLPRNPATGQPFPGDIVPTDPNALAMVNGMVPLPNDGVDGYAAAHSVPTNFREESIRVDQNISEKASLFVRFTSDYWDQIVTPALWTGSSFDTTQTNFQVPAAQDVLHLTYNFRPNVMNEFIMAYADDPHYITPQTGPSSPAHSVFKPSTWTANNLFPPNRSNHLLPGFDVSGGTPFSFISDSGPWPFGKYNTNPIPTWKENLAYTVGTHTIKSGFFLEKYRKNEQWQYVDNQGIFTFSSSSAVTTGNALADAFVGRIASYSEGTMTNNGVPIGGYGMGRWRGTTFEPYFQDDWKASRRLSINLGFRYYMLIPMHDTSHPTEDSTFIPSLYNPALEALLDSNGNLVIDPATGHVHDYTTYGNGLVQCGTAGIPKGCEKPFFGGFGPRFGFAFDPFGHGKTVIRGGYGIYYEPGNANDALANVMEGNPPAGFAPTTYNFIGYQKIGPGPIAPETITTIPYDAKRPSVQQYSLSLEHEFAWNNLLSISYVGNQGRHLGTERNLNQVPVGIGTMIVPELAGTIPACNAQGVCNVQDALINTEVANEFFVPYRGYLTIWDKQTTAISNYNALQVGLRHTFSHGLTYQVAYAWSHMLDNSTSTYFATSVDDNYDLSRWYANSDLNRSQSLVMNYVYNLPFFKASPNAFLRHTVGGWELSGISSFFSGLPVDFSCGVSGYGTGIGTGVRCNSVGPLKIKKGVVNDPQFGPVPTWFDPSVITQPLASQLPANGEPGMFGYVGRNPLTGPGRNNWDLALLKNISLPWFGHEPSKLQFRLETYNTFNHPQWKSISIGCSSTIGFGLPCTQVGNGEVSGAWNPRLVQLGMEFDF